MADHIDYAAQILKDHLDPPMKNPRVMEFDDNYPWIGLVLVMFERLRERGFQVVREDQPPMAP